MALLVAWLLAPSHTHYHPGPVLHGPAATGWDFPNSAFKDTANNVNLLTVTTTTPNNAQDLLSASPASESESIANGMAAAAKANGFRLVSARDSTLLINDSTRSARLLTAEPSLLSEPFDTVAKLSSSDGLQPVAALPTVLPHFEGGSVGVYSAIAWFIALSDKPTQLSKPVAATGTVLPDGSVAEVDGVEAKVAAARKAGMTTVFVPESNWRRLSDEDKLNTIPVSTVEQVFEKLPLVR